MVFANPVPTRSLVLFQGLPGSITMPLSTCSHPVTTSRKPDTKCHNSRFLRAVADSLHGGSSPSSAPQRLRQRATAAVYGGTEPDLLDEIASWQTGDFWQYDMYGGGLHPRRRQPGGRPGARGMPGPGRASWPLGAIAPNIVGTVTVSVARVAAL